jgi:hypothetical protein
VAETIDTPRYVRNNAGIVGRVISDHPARGRVIVEVVDHYAVNELDWFSIDTTDVEIPDELNGYTKLVVEALNIDQDGNDGRRYSRGELVELIEDLGAALQTTAIRLATATAATR